MIDRKNLLKAIFASARPSSSHSSANIDQAVALVKENRRITINELAESLGVSAGSAVNIMVTLGYSKVCARWVPRQLTEALKFWSIAKVTKPFCSE